MDDALVSYQEKNIDDLQGADYNPRKELKPGDKEYENLRKSIKEFGYVEPIIWNKHTETVVGGHQRMNVLKDLGYEKITVSVIDIDEQKEKALNMALNKISGEWNESMLKDLLLDVDTGDFDMDLTGFDESEIEKLMNKFADEEEERPEKTFTEELMEEHNYVVLYFDNQMDWQTAVDKLGIQTVHAKDSKEGYERAGVGRVIRGVDVVERLD